MERLSVEQFSSMIEHTTLKPDATEETVRAHCKEAKKWGFKLVVSNCAMIPYIKDELKDSNLLCGAAISFPLGQQTIETKVFEVQDAIAKGADEIDYVMNISKIKDGQWDYIRREMEEIVQVCQEKQVVSKAIFENCYLEDFEIDKLCEIAVAVKPTYIKTSTGFGTGGATLEDVKRMKAGVGDIVAIKVAGGVKTYQQALAFVEAGATRIGTSSGAEIIEAYQNQ